MLVFLMLVILLALLFYKFSKRNEDYWKKRNIPYNKPFFLFVEKSMFGLRSVSDEFLESYKRFPNEPIFGGLAIGKQAITIKDPDLIREVTVKSFDHFIDHADIFIDERLDPILAANLTFLRGKQWKKMRSMISPLFTGKKMRIMLELAVDCCQQLVDDTVKKAQSNQPIILEGKSFFSRLTSDITATCAFGIKCNSVMDENNEFHKKSAHLATFSAKRFLITSVFNKICLMINFGLVPKNVYEYFRKFVHETIQTREERNIVRPDMIQLMMQARKNEPKQFEEEPDDDTEYSAAKDTTNYLNKITSKMNLSNDDILAQVLLFILAGYETSSTALAFSTYELAVNPDIQKKLQAEIDESIKSCDGNITYEKLKALKYLDMVISETLRRYPPAPILNRICTQDFDIKTKNISTTIRKGENVVIPTIGLHHDPKYFPNPNKFDPERFSKDNQKNIVDFTYMPFGLGPRNCVGSRFALMQVKVTLVSLLSKFDFCVCSKTQIPIKYAKTPVRVRPEKGAWIELKLRK